MKLGKTSGFFRIQGLGGLFILFMTIGGCTSPQMSDPFAESKFDPYDQELGKRIEAYHRTNDAGYAGPKSGNPALYIDFSSGINKAFADPSIKGMMTNCFNTILAEKFDVYKLGANQVTPLNVSNTTELGQQVSDPKQYADIWAPIQKAVEQIVAGHQDALLITDFEEWQKNIEVTNAAFLKIPFSKWLAKGNAINFFIADYKEGGISKHLYFTVFTHGRPDASSMVSKLAPKLEPLTTRFDLSSQAYQLKTAYPDEKSGGLFYDNTAKSEKARNVLDLKGNYLNGLKNNDHFEFYPLGIDWENIAKLYTTYQSQHLFNDFFRKLYIDLNHEDSYVFGNFEVKVSDVTADFELFARSDEAKKHQPKLTKGSNGEAKFADGQTDAIALTCYDTNGKLKSEWTYKPAATASLNEVFVLNRDLFNNTKNSNEKRAELGVSFHSKFNVKNITNPGGLMKVDIVLSAAAPNVTNTKLSKFQWVNAKHVNNIALYESIKNTLQEVNPASHVVYSYYIKTQQP